MAAEQEVLAGIIEDAAALAARADELPDMIKMEEEGGTMEP